MPMSVALEEDLVKQLKTLLDLKTGRCPSTLSHASVNVSLVTSTDKVTGLTLLFLYKWHSTDFIVFLQTHS